ncbi:hypothetical protein EMCRGX_G020178 [Ephydatia muelleri]|eukprot:Em0016g113a
MASLSREERDYLYSPSKWSRRLPSDEVVTVHARKLTEATHRAQTKGHMRRELNVKYAGPGSQTLDIYYPDGDIESSDVFIYIHGGYWQLFGTEHSGFMALPFNSRGILVAVVGYDLAPKVTMTEIVEQCRQACVYLRLKFAKSRLLVCGHSAGAHLAACLLATDWSQYGLGVFPFSGAVLLSGIYDLTPIQQTYVNDPLQLTKDEVMMFSPIKTVERLTTLPAHFSVLLAIGEQESPEFKRQMAEYGKELQSLGLLCSFHELMGEDHFSLTEQMESDDCALNKLIFDMMDSSPKL